MSGWDNQQELPQAEGKKKKNRGIRESKRETGFKAFCRWNPFVYASVATGRNPDFDLARGRKKTDIAEEKEA